MAASLRGLPAKQPYRTLLLVGVFVSAWIILVRLFFRDEDSLAITTLDDSSENANHQLCAAHGFTPYPVIPQAPRRKVYDLTMVNTELDWLEIRLDALYDEVDLFVVVESPKTFHGHPKPMLAKESWDRFAKYHDKMLHHELEFPSSFHPRRTWDYETLQRDASFEQVFPKLTGDRAPALGDVLVVADVDEIPRPDTLRTLRACTFPRRLTLYSQFYYYSFQFRKTGSEWQHPQATFYEGQQQTLKPDDLRSGKGGFPVLRWFETGSYANSSWHCSSCFDSIELFLNKMASFSHKWMNGAQFRDRDKIAAAVREGQDLWGRSNNKFVKVEDNEDLPPMVQNDTRFTYMRDRSGESAGFRDYP